MRMWGISGVVYMHQKIFLADSFQSSYNLPYNLSNCVVTKYKCVSTTLCIHAFYISHISYVFTSSNVFKPFLYTFKLVACEAFGYNCNKKVFFFWYCSTVHILAHVVYIPYQSVTIQKRDQKEEKKLLGELHTSNVATLPFAQLSLVFFSTKLKLPRHPGKVWLTPFVFFYFKNYSLLLTVRFKFYSPFVNMGNKRKDGYQRK